MGGVFYYCCWCIVQPVHGKDKVTAGRNLLPDIAQPVHGKDKVTAGRNLLPGTKYKPDTRYQVSGTGTLQGQSWTRGKPTLS